MQNPLGVSIALKRFWPAIRIRDNFVFFLILRLLCLQTVEIQHGSHLMVKIVKNLLMETGMLQNIFVLALMGKTQSTNLFSAYWWPLQSTQSLQYVPKTISQTGLLHLTRASTGTSAPCRRQWMNSKTCQQRPGNSLANKKIPGGHNYIFFCLHLPGKKSLIGTSLHYGCWKNAQIHFESFFIIN